MGEIKSKFNIEIKKYEIDRWSFGICLSHWKDETYIFANFYKWNISIGKFRKYEE